MASSLLVAGSRLSILRQRSSFQRAKPMLKTGDGEEKSEEVEVKVKKAVELMLWTDLPDWQQHGSELICTGYRKASNSVKDCLWSWTYVHNETVNIFSHIIGSAIFLCLPTYIFTSEIPPRFEVATTTDIIVCSTYFLGVALCFLLSVTFHTFMSHSQALYLLGMKFDFQGVLLLMWSATIPLIHYSFPRNTALQALYTALMTFLAALCSAVTFLPNFSGPHLGPYRAALFGSFGLGSFLAPISHGMLLNGVLEESRMVGLPWILATLVFNATGVVVYTLKFPERWFPRHFDLFGASHQIMHVMVVAAALAYTFAVLEAFDYKHG